MMNKSYCYLKVSVSKDISESCELKFFFLGISGKKKTSFLKIKDI